jgi:hypothetical protein
MNAQCHMTSHPAEFLQCPIDHGRPRPPLGHLSQELFVHASEVESIHKSSNTLIDSQDRQGEFDVADKLGEPKQRRRQTTERL